MKEKDVKATISEILSQMYDSGLLPRAGDAEYLQIRRRLHEYYNTGETDQTIREAIAQLSGDQWINIVPLTYRDKMTIEEIAELMDAERSTISRNKRRLCLEIFKRIK